METAQPLRPRRTQQQRSDGTTAALLTAASEAILETGPATSMSAIAARAGVTKGALQHHFSNKNDLFVALVTEGWNELIGHCDISPDLAQPVVQRVRSLLNAMWWSYQASKPRAAFMISIDPNLDENLANHLAPGFRDARALLDALWAASFSDLRLDPAQTRLARRFARSHLLGMLVQRQLPAPEPDPEIELAALAITTAHLMTSAIAS